MEWILASQILASQEEWMNDLSDREDSEADLGEQLGSDLSFYQHHFSSACHAVSKNPSEDNIRNMNEYLRLMVSVVKDAHLLEMDGDELEDCFFEAVTDELSVHNGDGINAGVVAYNMDWGILSKLAGMSTVSLLTDFTRVSEFLLNQRGPSRVVFLEALDKYRNALKSRDWRNIIHYLVVLSQCFPYGLNVLNIADYSKCVLKDFDTVISLLTPRILLPKMCAVPQHPFLKVLEVYNGPGTLLEEAIREDITRLLGNIGYRLWSQYTREQPPIVKNLDKIKDTDKHTNDIGMLEIGCCTDVEGSSSKIRPSRGDPKLVDETCFNMPKSIGSLLCASIFKFVEKHMQEVYMGLSYYFFQQQDSPYVRHPRMQFVRTFLTISNKLWIKHLSVVYQFLKSKSDKRDMSLISFLCSGHHDHFQLDGLIDENVAFRGGLSLLILTRFKSLEDDSKVRVQVDRNTYWRIIPTLLKNLKTDRCAEGNNDLYLHFLASHVRHLIHKSCLFNHYRLDYLRKILNRVDHFKRKCKVSSLADSAVAFVAFVYDELCKFLSENKDVFARAGVNVIDNDDFSGPETRNGDNDVDMIEKGTDSTANMIITNTTTPSSAMESGDSSRQTVFVSKHDMEWRYGRHMLLPIKELLFNLEMRSDRVVASYLEFEHSQEEEYVPWIAPNVDTIDQMLAKTERLLQYMDKVNNCK